MTISESQRVHMPMLPNLSHEHSLLLPISARHESNFVDYIEGSNYHSRRICRYAVND